MTSQQDNETSTGGAATASGEDFRADVATVVAIHLLAQSPLWNPSPMDAVPVAVRCEAATKIDDIAVSTRSGRLLIQAKGDDKLSIPPNAMKLKNDDAFVKAIAQLVAQQQTPSPLDVATDRFVLAYREATEELKRLKKIAERVASIDVSSDEGEGRIEVLRTDEDRGTFARFELVIQRITGTMPAWQQLISLLKLALFWKLPEGVTDRIQIDPGNLMRSVLADGESCESAIDIVSRKILSLAAIASGVDIDGLRAYLGLKFKLEAIPDCARDIKRIHATSAVHADNMRRWQRPPFGQYANRGLVPDLLTAVDGGPVVVIGDRGLGKSATVLACVEELEGRKQQFLICDLKQTGSSLFTQPGDPPFANSLDRILAAFPHPLPVFLLLDGMEELGGQRELEKAVLALIGRVQRTPRQWRLIAFARPSTLRGRREIQSFFAGAPVRDPVAEFGHVRHVGLGPLSGPQLDSILSSAPLALQTLATEPSVRAFLSIPETVSMLSEVLADGVAPAMYQKALLQKYWRTYATTSSHETALIVIAKAQRKVGAMVSVAEVVASGVSLDLVHELHNNRVVVAAAGKVGLVHELVGDFIRAEFPDG